MQQKLKHLIIVRIIAICLCVFVMIIALPKVHAETKAFDVITVIPDNQVDKNATYFDLKLDKGEKQTLEVILKNTTKKSITVVAGFNRQTTNSDGVIDYSVTNDTPDKSLAVDIESSVKLANKKIVIKANSEKKLMIDVTAPKQDFVGILAGGLTFDLLKATKESTEKTDVTGIQNTYGYEVALILHGNVSVEELPSELNLSTVGVSNQNGLNKIFANLQNPQPKFLTGVTIDSELTEKTSSTVVLKQKRDDIQVAPNSNFDYSMFLNGTILEAGTYRLTLAMTVGSEQIDYEKEFEITETQAQQILEEATPNTKERNTLWYLLLGLLVIVGSLIVLLVMFKKSRIESDRRTVKKKKRTHNKRS